jgi:hypothetical protein
MKGGISSSLTNSPKRLGPLVFCFAIKSRLIEVKSKQNQGDENEK